VECVSFHFCSVVWWGAVRFPNGEVLLQSCQNLKSALLLPKELFDGTLTNPVFGERPIKQFILERQSTRFKFWYW